MTPDSGNSQSVPRLRRLVAGNSLQKIQRLSMWDLQWTRVGGTDYFSPVSIIQLVFHSITHISLIYHMMLAHDSIAKYNTSFHPTCMCSCVYNQCTKHECCTYCEFHPHFQVSIRFTVENHFSILIYAISTSTNKCI